MKGWMMPATDVEVKLIGEDGNAFFIIGAVSQALKRNGYESLVDEYQEKAMSGDYSHLLSVTNDYVIII
jgi:hypothetical protein